MPRYKIRFSRHWITGRWGFTDRALNAIGGHCADPSLNVPVWVVEYKGPPGRLGRYLTETLKIPLAHEPGDGAIFEIEEVRTETRPRRATSSNVPNRRDPALTE